MGRPGSRLSEPARAGLDGHGVKLYFPGRNFHYNTSINVYMYHPTIIKTSARRLGAGLGRPAGRPALLVQLARPPIVPCAEVAVPEVVARRRHPRAVPQRLFKPFF